MAHNVQRIINLTDGGLKTALILDHRLEAVADAELFMGNAAAVVDMRSIVAMLNAKLIKISTRRSLKPRFLAHLCAFSPDHTRKHHIIEQIKATSLTMNA